MTLDRIKSSSTITWNTCWMRAVYRCGISGDRHEFCWRGQSKNRICLPAILRHGTSRTSINSNLLTVEFSWRNVSFHAQWNQKIQRLFDKRRANAPARCIWMQRGEKIENWLTGQYRNCCKVKWSNKNRVFEEILILVIWSVRLMLTKKLFLGFWVGLWVIQSFHHPQTQ